MMAHEANDNICLQHALAWLYKLNDENKVCYKCTNHRNLYNKLQIISQFNINCTRLQ